MYRYFTFALGLAVILPLTQESGVAQTQANNTTAGKQTYSPPRTGDGKPDLQGVWANNNATPLQRPKVLEGRAFLTPEEVTALKAKANELFNGQSDAAFGDMVYETVFANVRGTKSGFTQEDGVGGYESLWMVQRDWDNRTSLITDPKDGRIPPMTPAAQKIAAADAAANQAERTGHGTPATGPEDRPLGERCITSGSPHMGAGYNSYFQIAQSPNSIAILAEMMHDVRMIRLDGSPHPPSNVQLWLGDSRGHWEGDTLVVDTTNYLPGVFRKFSTDKLHVVEKFTRTGDDVVQWEITIDDPGAWTKPWTAMIPLRRSKDPIFEYACHEDNYGLYNILAGARAEEKH